MWNLFTYAQPCDAAGTDFLGGGGGGGYAGL